MLYLPPTIFPVVSGITFKSFTLGAANTATISVSNSSGANLAILLAVNRGVSQASVTATYNGSSMTKVTGAPAFNAGNNSVTAYYILNPSSGTTNVVMTGESGTYIGAVYLFSGAVGTVGGWVSNTSGGNPGAVTSDAQSIVIAEAIYSDGVPGALTNTGATTDGNAAVGLAGYTFGRIPGASSVSPTFSGTLTATSGFSIK